MSHNNRVRHWNSAIVKPKQQNISEIVQQRRVAGVCNFGQVDLRDILVQRTMARHGFSREQAIALIVAFGGS